MYSLFNKSDRSHSSEENSSDRLRRMSTLLHIYYVFSSTLLASCSEVMTFGCELVAE
ncbi:hypothetical protein [Nostoc sphaeroides]|uniref:Uncharacterized protein n=1 Tax=Nostoc sphaeroides CCNUC1 TaxID=2653204 RepID=A0A5P8WAF4_9NOSO|nr:hypothetical protein [Nostoc sphaeroides]QFS49660.1 hypothetical protein GXM_07154 [Nostoc sphaeroides CCNUC1]